MSRDPLTVLIVEDDPHYGALIEDMLRLAGQPPMHLLRVRSLRDALARLRQVRCDAIILDLQLPDSTDLDTLTPLVEAHPEIPILVLTGAVEDLALKAYEAGAEEFLSKTEATPERLWRQLLAAMARRRHNRDLFKRFGEVIRALGGADP